MAHSTPLITNITLGLVAAFIGGFVATRLRLPAIVGYLLAGIAVGPFTPGPVGDTRIASELAEIGVILLMFGVGIHFSLRDLMSVRGVAVPGALGQIAATTAMGAGLCAWWGWPLPAGLVFGLALSVASTVVLIRALMEREMLDTLHGRVAVGWMIVEDLFTVLALVLLPAFAALLGGDTQAGPGARGGGSLALTLGLALGKTALFVALMVFIGARAVPWLLVQVARTGSRELFTLSVLALALGIAVASAQLFGVSLALGAFLAGMVIGESDLSHQAAADALPMRDAFAVLFFLSVGMLFDPRLLLEAPDQILAVLAIVLIGKAASAIPIVLLLGWPLRTALTVGAALARIGEFSFIVAGFGRSLGLFSDRAFQLIIAGSMISIALNPLVFGLIDPLEAWLRRRPLLAALRERRAGALTRLPDPVDEESLTDHAVIVGYGRVGSLIGELLEQRGFPRVIVELSQRRVEELRRAGVPAIYGDAANPDLLAQVHLDRARVLVVAIPDAPATRLIVEHARARRPDLEIVARTHSDSEWRYLSERVSEAVLGEREAALEMARLSLSLFGVEPAQVQTLIEALRNEVRLGSEEVVFAKQ